MFIQISVILILIHSLISGAMAQSPSEAVQANKYQDCISEISVDNEKALIRARKWIVEGGAVAAQHCEAMALFDQERFDEAAGLLENVGDKVAKGEGVGLFASQNKEFLAVQLRYTAGKSWMSAGKPERAYNIYTVALMAIEDKSPLSYDLYIERALVQLSREEYLSAVDDLNQALGINADKVDAFLFRAEAFRKMGEHVKARLDINEGLIISPNQPDLIFESGVNYRMLRDNEKARNEWQKLIEQYPGTHWQKLAEDNIELING
ncbi:MAG: tetratricopeptide repeat protein [Emcibacteraceae bacterium]|nr:tetratricopeptide repeat protein [Emcibacteraceae bacterium]MDG1859107.1 tetratricopeptide repeat protein [Emcibacteraceae bacterium]